MKPKRRDLRINVYMSKRLVMQRRIYALRERAGAIARVVELLRRNFKHEYTEIRGGVPSSRGIGVGRRGLAKMVLSESIEVGPTEIFQLISGVQ
jgi:hypothetical protein